MKKALTKCDIYYGSADDGRAFFVRGYTWVDVEPTGQTRRWLDRKVYDTYHVYVDGEYYGTSVSRHLILEDYE